MHSKTEPLTDAELNVYEADRDLAAALRSQRGLDKTAAEPHG